MSDSQKPPRKFLTRPAVIDWLQWSDEFVDKIGCPDYPQLTLSLIQEYVDELKVNQSAYDALKQQAQKMREALAKTRGAMTYAYEDRCDQYYLNVKDDIEQALEQFDEFMRGVK